MRQDAVHDLQRHQCKIEHRRDREGTAEIAGRTMVRMSRVRMPLDMPMGGIAVMNVIMMIVGHAMPPLPSRSIRCSVSPVEY
jgi:hypothetical protein